MDTDDMEGLAEAKWRLKECRDLHCLLLVTDIDGYNILQVAVIHNDQSFIQVGQKSHHCNHHIIIILHLQ